MNLTRAKTLLKRNGQEQLLQYYDELTEEQKTALLSDVEKINFDVLKHLKNKETAKKAGKLSPISAVSLEEIKRRKPQFDAVGLDALNAGKVGAVLLAGGQGSRLGFDGPKGMFNIGETRVLSIFEQQMENIKDVTRRSGRHFPLFVMTSVGNDAATRKFFSDNNYFGYPKESVYFYIQDLAPACDFDGKVFLDQKHRVSFAPNGNGGWYSSLVNSGLGEVLASQNVEWLNVYSVDNVLQRICDPTFIGATIMKNCRCGAKVVKKVSPDEKVGVLCKRGGKPSIIEYYELPDDVRNLRKDGELVYRYGVILNYLFNVSDLNATLSGKLPYHFAKKAIAHVENGVRVQPAEPCGYKFETLVVDQVGMMDSCLAYEVDREREFAPVKNATGVDSVVTARQLLKLNGVKL